MEVAQDIMQSAPPKRPGATAMEHAQRAQELANIILAYNQITERLQKSHGQLQQTVQALRSELVEKNRQLERRQRLAALGEMAAGMAHEIRNPLGGIQLYASMLSNDVRHMPASAELVGKISSGVKRLEGLVSQVLQFTREMDARPVSNDLAELVDEAIEMAAAKMNAAGVKSVASGPRPMPVRVDPLLMGQAILNLLINAVEAMEESRNRQIDVKWCAGEAKNGFRLTIRDRGPGITAESLDRIFNPFFTTKGSGTGLGLAIVHRIVEAHDGTIAVSNEPDGGAKFEIRI